MYTILIVDDDAEYTDILRDLLSPTRYRVIVAGNGEQGVGLAQKESPDLIIMDLWLPDIDGVEATRQIKASGGLTAVPVLLCSGLGDDPEQMGLAKEAGCCDQIVKSDILGVLHKIESLLPTTE